jgi:tRNA pseudouridine13 synthase
VENTDSLGATTWIDARTKISAWTNEACAEEVVRVLEYWENNSDTADGMSKFAELPAISDKDTRKAIHQWIRASLAGIAVGDTHEGKIRIWHKRFEKETSSFGKFDRPGKARNERLKRWPSDRPDYLQFVLYKENIDTTVAVKDVSKRVKGKTHIGYAGMKDKRGVTSQFCTIYRKQADDILSINKSRDGSGGNSTYGSVSVVRVGNFKYVDRELSLGMLRGNRFDVVLRNVGIGGKDMEAARKYVDKAARAFKKHGFINYFG